jgi:hypothetical protein
LISAALLFNNNGLADLWDDIDPWVRNQFVENQLSPARSDMMMRQAAKQEKWTPGLYVSTERLQERAVGTFTGTPRINEWGSGMSNCCIASGARCVYQVWKNILREQDGKLKINLPLNRASKWADVDSHIPYTGRVDVHVKEPVELSIRIPKWVKPAEARVQVVNTVARASNTIQDREVEWDGRYVKVGRVNPRDVVKLTFPIGERSEQSAVLPERSTLIIKGNEVVAVSPPGISCPTYQREHYRTDTTRWRNTQRFVSREELDW